jgi:hypothetical protein
MFRLTIKLVIFALLAHGAFRVGMPFWNFVQFRDAVKETATYADTPSVSGRRTTPDQVLDKLAKIARDLDVPLDREDFLMKTDKQGTTIDARYTMQLEYFPRQYYPYEFVVHAVGEPSRYRASARP